MIAIVFLYQILGLSGFFNPDLRQYRMKSALFTSGDPDFPHFHAVVFLSALKGVRKGLGLTPPLSLIFYKNFITFARRLIVFAYFLIVNLST